MLNHKKVGVLSVMLAGSVLMSGCEETELDIRQRIISEMIQKNVSGVCLARGVEARKKFGMGNDSVAVRKGAVEMCNEVGRLASEAKSKQIAAFGVAGVLVLNDNAYSIMSSNFKVVYLDRETEEYNSTWGLTKRFVVWLFERNG